MKEKNDQKDTAHCYHCMQFDTSPKWLPSPMNAVRLAVSSFWWKRESFFFSDDPERRGIELQGIHTRSASFLFLVPYRALD
jgi:hypothetical protein